MYGISNLGLYGAAADDTTYYVQMDSIRIGGAGFSNLQVRSSSNTSNLLGNKFLDDYRVFISWRNEMIYLKPYATPELLLLPDNECSFFLRDSSLYVSGIYEGSILWDKNVSVGDKVVDINGEQISVVSDDTFCEWIDSIDTRKQYQFSVESEQGIVRFELPGKAFITRKNE